jgi:hypothetical protein
VQDEVENINNIEKNKDSKLKNVKIENYIDFKLNGQKMLSGLSIPTQKKLKNFQ